MSGSSQIDGCQEPCVAHGVGVVRLRSDSRRPPDGGRRRLRSAARGIREPAPDRYGSPHGLAPGGARRGRRRGHGPGRLRPALGLDRRHRPRSPPTVRCTRCCWPRSPFRCTSGGCGRCRSCCWSSARPGCSSSSAVRSTSPGSPSCSRSTPWRRTAALGGARRGRGDGGGGARRRRPQARRRRPGGRGAARLVRPGRRLGARPVDPAPAPGDRRPAVAGARPRSGTGAEQAARAVAEERARIARELHDLVAHSMGVIVIQAQAGQRALDREPESARAALASIETAGRQGLAEMRRLLGLLTSPQDSTVSPQPGLGDLPALVDRLRERRASRSTSSVDGDLGAARRASTWPPTGSCRRRSPTCSSTPARRRRTVVVRSARRRRRRRGPRRRPRAERPSAGRSAGTGWSACGNAPPSTAAPSRPGSLPGRRLPGPGAAARRRDAGMTIRVLRRRRRGAGAHRAAADPRRRARPRRRRHRLRRRGRPWRRCGGCARTSSSWTSGCPASTGSRPPGGSCAERTCRRARS